MSIGNLKLLIPDFFYILDSWLIAKCITSPIFKLTKHPYEERHDKKHDDICCTTNMWLLNIQYQKRWILLDVGKAYNSVSWIYLYYKDTQFVIFDSHLYCVFMTKELHKQSKFVLFLKYKDLPNVLFMTSLHWALLQLGPSQHAEQMTTSPWSALLPMVDVWVFLYPLNNISHTWSIQKFDRQTFFFFFNFF